MDLVSKSKLVGTTIFLGYALATSLVLLVIALLLGKATLFFKNLGQEKYEILITRASGILIAAFGIYMFFLEMKPIM